MKGVSFSFRKSIFQNPRIKQTVEYTEITFIQHVPPDHRAERREGYSYAMAEE